MADLLTKCPSCAVTFQVTTAQQRIANGQVRCSNCQQTFLATEQAIAKREVTSQGVVNKPIEADEQLIYDDMPLAKSEEETPSTRNERDNLTTATNTSENNVFSIPNPQDLLEEPQLSPTTPPSRRRTLGYSSLCILLLLLLAAQYAHNHAIPLAQSTTFTPIINQLCQLSGCNTVYRNHAELKTRNFSVSSHPTTNNALLMEGQLVNLGSYPQPYPRLSITFEDLDGHIVAQRLFEPREYLGTTNSGTTDSTSSTQISPRQSTAFNLSVVDLGNKAQSYTLSIH